MKMRFVQRCLQWCWFTWILAWVHIYDFSGSVKVHHWLLFFLAVFQTASSLSPIKRHPGIYLYSVPSWATDCYVRLSVTHTHTHVQTPCFSFIMRLRLKTQTSCGSRQTTLSHTSLISCSLTSLHLYFLPSLWSTCQTQTPTKYFV